MLEEKEETKILSESEKRTEWAQSPFGAVWVTNITPRFQALLSPLFPLLIVIYSKEIMAEARTMNHRRAGRPIINLFLLSTVVHYNHQLSKTLAPSNRTISDVVVKKLKSKSGVRKETKI